MANENAIRLSTETSSPVEGGPVRTITATLMVNGVPTQVQMQVIALSDENGAILGSGFDPYVMADALRELRAIRVLVEMFLGVYQLPGIDDLPINNRKVSPH